MAPAALPWESPAGAGEAALRVTPAANPSETFTRQRRQGSTAAAAAAAGEGGPAAARLDRLYQQLQRPLFELADSCLPCAVGPRAQGAAAAASSGGVGKVTADTVFEPVDGHFKIPHGVWMVRAHPPFPPLRIPPAPSRIVGAMTRGVAQREATAVAVDSTDRVFVFNRGNLPIIVFDADGNCLNTWGNDTPGRGTETIPSSGTTQPTINRWIGSEFMRPHAITIDHEDNLWLVDDDANVITKCDREGNRLMMILPEGVVLTEATDIEKMKGKGAPAPPTNSGKMFNRPTDIAVHPETGDLYVSDGYGNNVVHRLRSDGTHISTWGAHTLKCLRLLSSIP